LAGKKVGSPMKFGAEDAAIFLGQMAMRFFRFKRRHATAGEDVQGF